MRKMVTLPILAVLAAIAHAQAPPQAQDQVSVEISGATNPELIPDRDAYWMLFLNMADGPKAFSRDARIRFLQFSGLTDMQLDAVIRAANDYQAETSPMRKSRELILKSNPQRPIRPEVLADLRSVAAEEGAALDSRIQTLRSQLDAEGRWKLKKFLNTRVKATMVLTKPE